MERPRHGTPRRGRSGPVGARLFTLLRPASYEVEPQAPSVQLFTSQLAKQELE